MKKREIDVGLNLVQILSSGFRVAYNIIRRAEKWHSCLKARLKWTQKEWNN